MAAVDVLIPTCDPARGADPALSGLVAQTRRDLRVVIADQSTEPAACSQVSRAVASIIEVRGD